MRIKRLQEFINEHELDAALITRRENLFYFTGGSAPVLGGYLVVTPPDDALFIVPELEYEEAKANSKVPVEKFKTGKELYERLSSFRPRKLGIEGKTSFSTVQTLKEKAGGAKDFVPHRRGDKGPEDNQGSRGGDRGDKGRLRDSGHGHDGGARGGERG